jgi:hypothetical protein
MDHYTVADTMGLVLLDFLEKRLRSIDSVLLQYAAVIFHVLLVQTRTSPAKPQRTSVRYSTLQPEIELADTPRCE